MRKKILAAMLPAGFLFLGILLISEPKVWGSQENKLEIILPSGIIQLYSPVEIKDVQLYRDGGTIGITLRDKNGVEFPFCLDGRMQSVKFGETAKPNHIYIGAVHSDSPLAQSIPIGGKEEKSILRILRACVDVQLSPEQQKSPLDGKNAGDLSEEKIKAYRALRVIKTLENR